MTALAPAKINAFLKITGKRDSYHEMISRFIKLPHLHDTITFQERPAEGIFTLEGDFSCTIEQNTIYKAYHILLQMSDKKKIKKFFKVHKVAVQKNIPTFAGLGGGSSDAATFLKMCNEHIGLNLEQETLAEIGASIGADVPFFIYDFTVANVSGIGDIVAPYEDEGLEFTTFTPDIACDTAAVFKNYSQKFYRPIGSKEKHFFATLKTSEVLDLYTIDKANDLYNAAKDLYPELSKHADKNRFFSGSGSTFFSLKDK